MTPDTLPTPAARVLCDALLQARARGQALDLDPALLAGAPDDETGCAVAHAQGVALGAWAADAVPGHWKSGGPGRQARLTHAPLLPAGVHTVAQGQVADLRGLSFFAPRIEAEIALRLGQAVTPAQAAALTPEDAARVVDAFALSMEVVDSRWAAGAVVPPPAQLADFQVHGALVLGPWQPLSPRDWTAQALTLAWDGQDSLAFTGTHTLGGPLWGVPAWLRHLTRHGQTVPAGTVVTTGSWSGCRPVPRGATVRLAFEGLGTLACQL
ncbi:fumarylacetoacetate hydrolase family protein [Ideonella livida]|uniref:2-keto-4-pentenoate hydratase n=1 Tax=Ideonella livida TaxID=2707176 RepID=A0A7C9PKM3_9BURK|nr:fumarylacetoacetate hydrolase family protein [Ideonella livida]NDY93671.1 2-keto-4-pentenoate hydratase [Ideonella livida]